MSTMDSARKRASITGRDVGLANFKLAAGTIDRMEEELEGVRLLGIYAQESAVRGGDG